MNKNKQLCEYGCGNEAKYQFKNNRWCCSKNYSSCQAIREKRSKHLKHKWNSSNELKDKLSKKLKKKHDDPNSLYNSVSYLEKRSKLMKELWNDKDSIFNTNSYRKQLSESIKNEWNKPNSIFNSSSYRKKRSQITKNEWNNEKSNNRSKSRNKKLSVSRLFSIKKIKKLYPFFSKIEEMRYNPDKPGEKEIQIHCKNHNCENSKEKGGWFTPTRSQIQNRKNNIENKDGNDGSYFYCSNKCKEECPLYNLQSDPFKKIIKSYTDEEYNIWRKEVLIRDNYECQKCGTNKYLHCHHIIPVKIKPMLSLDPENGICLCEKCHYKIGHKSKTECSTGNLANKNCNYGKKYE